MNRRFALPLQKGVWEKHPRANWAPGKPIWKSGMLRERLLINWVEVGFQDWGSRYGFCRDRVGINPWGISCDFREQFHAELPLHFQILAWEFPQWRETFFNLFTYIQIRQQWSMAMAQKCLLREQTKMDSIQVQTTGSPKDGKSVLGRVGSGEPDYSFTFDPLNRS